MAKSQITFRCSECMEVTSKWQGQCPACFSWSTLREDTSLEEDSSLLQKAAKGASPKGVAKKGMTVKEALSKEHAEKRIDTEIEEYNRVLGGGIVPGSLVLFSGEPGIGKSTLTLEVAAKLSRTKKVLYVSGEENETQIAMRAKRMGYVDASIDLVQENVLEHILATCKKSPPEVLILDSIQVLYSLSIGAQAGSISQIRFVTEVIMEYAKTASIAVILIGHVTKDGTIAGPKVLEHLVDTVLLLEGDRSGELRLLRSIKNRFGATDEVGVFRMDGEGLKQVPNPSQFFLSGKRPGATGSTFGAVVEGTRCFYVEVQSLTSYTKFGYPKRTCVGYPMARLPMILAVLERYAGAALGSDDVYVNVVGGLVSRDTALDCSVAASVLSSKAKKELSRGVAFIGEIGLTGEIRTVPHLEKRIKEALKVGVEEVVLPVALTNPPAGIKVTVLKTVEELARYIAKA